LTFVHVIFASVLSATNDAEIDAYVGSVAGSLAIGGVVGVAVGIGFSLAENFIGWNESGDAKAQVFAYVDGSSIDAMGDLSITAKNQAIIHSGVDAAAVAIGGGFVAGAASGAGTDSVNRIEVDVIARIANTIGDGIIAQDVLVQADDEAIIRARTLAASLAASFGAFGGSVSISVSLADNTIADRALASVESATLLAGGDITITSRQNADIAAEAQAVSMSASVSLGFSLAGGGASAKATIKTTTLAIADKSTFTLDKGDVLIDASNTTKSYADVTAAAVSLGLAAAAAAGSVTEITTDPITKASLGDSCIVLSGGDVSISATADNTAKANSAGLSVSTGISIGSTDATGKCQQKCRRF